MPSRILNMEDSNSTTDAESTNSHHVPSSPTHPGEKSSLKPLTLTGPDCAVCTDHAPGGTSYRRHYGVICCEACKCFFRRTVQMNRDYKCRSDGKCYVGRTTENQKQVCQACRFQQCIRAGMKLDSVKRFPRKTRSTEGSQDEATKGSPPKVAKNSKLKAKRVRSNGHKEMLSVTVKKEPASDANGVAVGDSPGSDKEAGANMSSPGRERKNNIGDELQLCDTDLEDVKFKLSPSEAMMYLQSASTTVPQLFKYDSADSLHEKSAAVQGHHETSAPSDGMSHSGVHVSAARYASSNHEGCGHMKGGVGLKARRSPDDEQEGVAKRLCVGSEGLTNLAQYRSSQLPPNGGNLSTPPVTPLTPITPSHPHSQPPSRHHSPSLPLSQPPSRHHSPEPLVPNNVCYNNSPYVTPHGTPTHTPLHSPISSPTVLSHPPNYHPHPVSHPSLSPQGGTLSSGPPREKWPPISQPGDFLTSSPSSMSHFNMCGVTSQLHLQPPPAASPGAIIFNPHHTPTVPFQVLASTSLLPMVFSTHPHRPQLLSGASKSPFRIIPIPSINRTQPEEVPEEPEVNVCDSPDQGDMKPLVPGSAPPSACASPINSKPKKFTHFAEAKLEEVLDSLRLRIRSLFTWAKSEVSGFDDLSPLDQKALLRRTVPELVMLGFARGSIAYTDLLLLGSTGKVIRPTNQNSGVASVASVTLQKLVVPLKVLNIDDREFTLLKEIVLFNPESNGLRNREVVRVYRKDKHLKLMEYTEKSDDPGRFGDLLCLLTPLFEVSTEVTEQLRLEQFVHEGEARIDALLLMSMISGADEMPDEHSLDSQQLL